MLQVPLEVVFGGAEEAHAGASKGNLRRRGHGPEAVRVSFLFRNLQNRQNLREILSQSVYGISVVPHDAEVRCARLHRSEAAGLLFRDDGTRGVGEHRHNPHALNLRVLGQLLDCFDVRAIFFHRHRNQLETEGFRDGKVAVIPRGGADPLDGLFLGPRLLRAVGAEGVGPQDEVIHDVQGGRVRRNEELRIHVGELAPQIAQLLDALLVAVVAQVITRSIGVVAAPRQNEQIVGQIKLRLGRLTAGQVKIQPLSLEGLVVLAHLRGKLIKLGLFKIKKRHPSSFRDVVRTYGNHTNAPSHPPCESTQIKRGPRAPARAS